MLEKKKVKMKSEVVREGKEEMMEAGWVKQWIMCGNIYMP